MDQHSSSNRIGEDMASQYDDGPEVASSNLPQLDETSGGPQYAGTESSHPSTPFSFFSNKPGAYAYSPQPVSMGTTLVSPKERRICGLSLPVLILSIIIAFFAMSTIGLAAGVGVIANKYSNSNSQLEESNSKLADTNSKLKDAEYVPSLMNVTNGCWGYKGSDKTSKYLAKAAKDQLFTVYCNMDLIFDSFIGSYSGSFNNCMETCVIWNSWNMKPSCAGVAYLPEWTDKSMVASSNSIGDCYLKEGPITKVNLTAPRIQWEVDAAILNE